MARVVSPQAARRAVARVATAPIFARDPYESRRTALPGPRLLAALVLYQFTKDPSQAGLRRVVDESPAAQELLGTKNAEVKIFYDPAHARKE